MVIYEVNLTIDNEIYTSFRQWLEIHIHDILQCPGFIQATLLKPDTDISPLKKMLTIQYQLQNRDDLEKYFSEYAAAMRADGIKQFGDQFVATRKVFMVEKIIFSQ